MDIMGTEGPVGLAEREADGEQALARQSSPGLRAAALAAALSGGAGLSACGGGGGSAQAPVAAMSRLAASSAAISDASAARFLLQAGLGISRSQITQVQSLGFAGWLAAQFATPASTTNTRWNWLSALEGSNDMTSTTNFDQGVWRKLIQAPDSDELRQRVTLALSEILVVSMAGLSGDWTAYIGSGYLDLLESHAFGNFRDLLQAVSTSVAMAQYLTFLNNAKANPKTGSIPDENYARELMQLFTIGLVQLNLDGTPVTSNGQTVATYGQADVMGMAAVMTGWVLNDSSNRSNYLYTNKALVQNASLCDTGAKSFLGTTIPSGTDGATSLKLALDALFAHPNVAPFISRQLIQRLVSSNPSPAYVARVATVFNNDGTGVKGNLQAVVAAILLDTEARNDSAAASTPGFGKLREPVLRFLGWARAYRNRSNDASSSLVWNLGSTENSAFLGQSPLHSPTVFNFFYPNYSPPGLLSTAGLQAPEFQIANESSLVGFVNFMQNCVGSSFTAAAQVDYSSLTTAPAGGVALVSNPPALVQELNITLAAGRLSASVQSQIATALASVSNLTNRLHAALVLVLCAPETAVQK